MKVFVILLLFGLALLGLDVNDPAFQAWFKNANVGDTYSYSYAGPDGCNTCSSTVQKTSGSEITFTAGAWCTMINCPMPAFTIPVLPEPKTGKK